MKRQLHMCVMCLSTFFLDKSFGNNAAKIQYVIPEMRPVKHKNLYDLHAFKDVWYPTIRFVFYVFKYCMKYCRLHTFIHLNIITYLLPPTQNRQLGPKDFRKREIKDYFDIKSSFISSLKKIHCLTKYSSVISYIFTSYMCIVFAFLWHILDHQTNLNVKGHITKLKKLI